MNDEEEYLLAALVISGADSKLLMDSCQFGAGDVKSSNSFLLERGEENKRPSVLVELQKEINTGLQISLCTDACVCVCVSASHVFANWQWFTDKSLQRCAVTKTLTACQCRMIQISLHYKCKDEFKNTQDCELFSHSPHTLSTWCRTATVSNVENKWVTEDIVGEMSDVKQHSCYVQVPQNLQRN